MGFASIEAAREAGRKGGRRRRKGLSLQEVEQALGTLASPEDAMRWAATAFRWTAAQTIPGAAGGACASLIREWQKAFDAKVDRERIGELEGKIAELEAELSARQHRKGLP